MAPDDDDSEDLYDDEFDFVDDDDDEDDASDLDDDADDDSELDSALDSAGDVAADSADSELDEPPAPREAAAKRPARPTRGFDGDGDRGRDDADRDGVDRGSDRFDDEANDDRAGDDRAGDDEPVDEYVAPLPAANFRVHIYEHRQFKRTIDRPFTAEDAEAFASEFNRTSKSYGRFALAGKEDAKPRKMLDD